LQRKSKLLLYTTGISSGWDEYIVCQSQLNLLRFWIRNVSVVRLGTYPNQNALPGRRCGTHHDNLVLIPTDLAVIPTRTLLPGGVLVHTPPNLAFIPPAWYYLVIDMYSNRKVLIPTGARSQQGPCVLSQPEGHPGAIKGYPGMISSCISAPSGDSSD